MFGLAVLDVVIGLSFVYLVLSLACTAITELIEAAIKWRAKNLEKGIRALLRDPDGKLLAKDFYEHPLIAGLHKEGKKPTYIPARTFAMAILDIAGRKVPAAVEAASTGAKTVKENAPFAPIAELRETVASAAELEPVRDALLAMVDDARGDVERLRQDLEEWFNGAMDRAAGWYKRRAQWIVFAIGVGLAIGLNADTIAIVRVLSLDPKVRDAVVTAAGTYLQAHTTVTPTPSPAVSPAASAPTDSPETGARESEIVPTATPSPVPPTPTAEVTQPAGGDEGTPTPTPIPEAWGHFREQIRGPLEEIEKLGVLGLPLGWTEEARERGKSNAVKIIWKTVKANPLTLVGWLLTAVAISLGAPFWFDTLNKLVVVRSTVKPKEKSPEEASKDRTNKPASPTPPDTETRSKS